MAISYQGAFDKMQEKGVTTYRIRKEIYCHKVPCKK